MWLAAMADETAAVAARSRWVQFIETAAEHKYGTWALAAIAFADSSFLPIPPDLLLVPMALARPKRVWWLGIICTIASALGAIAGYLIGYELWSLIGEGLIAFYGYENAFALYQGLIVGWGPWIIIAKGLTPIPFKIVAIGAGVASMNPAVFFGAALLGRALHFAMLAGAIALWGDRARALVTRYHRWLLPVLVLLVTMVLVITHFAR